MRRLAFLIAIMVLGVLPLIPTVAFAEGNAIPGAQATSTPESLPAPESTATPETAPPPVSTPTPEEVAPTPSPVPKDFRQVPTFDLRTVNTVVKRDQDAQFELFIGNPTINGDVGLAGEILFRVPPGLTIFSTIQGGSGSTGVIQAPFANNPIRPGNTHVLSVFARSETVGTYNIFAVVTYWPQNSPDLAKSQNLNFRVQVTEASELVEPPSAVTEPTPTPGPIEPPPAPTATPRPVEIQVATVTPPPPPPPPDGGLSTMMMILIFLGVVIVLALIVALIRAL